MKTMQENSERAIRGVQMGKSGPLERAELANQIQGFRIPDHWDASEKKINWHYFLDIEFSFYARVMYSQQIGSYYLPNELLSPCVLAEN